MSWAAVAGGTIAAVGAVTASAIGNKKSKVRFLFQVHPFPTGSCP